MVCKKKFVAARHRARWLVDAGGAGASSLALAQRYLERSRGLCMCTPAGLPLSALLMQQGTKAPAGPRPLPHAPFPTHLGSPSALPSSTLVANSLALCHAQRPVVSQSRARYDWQEQAATCAQEWWPAVVVWLAQWSTHHIPRVECKIAPAKQRARWKQVARWGNSTLSPCEGQGVLQARSSHVRAECLPGKKTERGGRWGENGEGRRGGTCRKERPRESSWSAGRERGRGRAGRGRRVERKERGGDRARTSTVQRKQDERRGVHKGKGRRTKAGRATAPSLVLHRSVGLALPPFGDG